MSSHPSKGTLTIQNALNTNGLSCSVIELPTSARTAKEAAESIGCELSQIVKSLIFTTKDSQQPILILASGPNRISEAAISRHIGEDIVKADAALTKKITGFAIGGIPPIGHKNTIELIFIDQDLLNFDSLWAAAGTLHAVFNISSKDLVAITKAKIITIH
ncbi:YbaK/EbsC family protein [Candidatus Dojkabacteria bacterium]|uniref:YbaK/EbsC family protein n=1 Tax=Candidatus Dojkabacteria bacterium TaxID=2099670 RepID=A0A5C7J7K5_9BACT|nr:MAG: YbaK/EbsC family protein [Candidatus Dojkabacteria bacterium]